MSIIDLFNKYNKKISSVIQMIMLILYSNMTAEEYAYIMQNYYEQYYLNVW